VHTLGIKVPPILTLYGGISDAILNMYVMRLCAKETKMKKMSAKLMFFLLAMGCLGLWGCQTFQERKATFEAKTRSWIGKNIDG